MKFRLVVAAGLLLSLAACSSNSAVPTTSVSITPSNSTTGVACEVSPLTGFCADPKVPVLIVKIDDVGAARPQWALNEADVILVEPVEGGLTRLMAVYQSTQPVSVGPVRSARITDTDIVSAFGKPGFAYSGSMQRLVPLLKAASMQMVGAPQGGRGYSRDKTRYAPHNYIGDYQTLLSRIDDPIAAHLHASSYWKIGEVATRGTPMGSITVKWPAAEKSFTWVESAKSWAISIYNDNLGSIRASDKKVIRARARTVFVMNTVLQESPFHDFKGNRTPYPQTIGTGTGWVLTEGQSIKATWKRPTKEDLPRWFKADGTEITVTPGNVWWLMVTPQTSVSFHPVQTASPSASVSAK